MFHDLDATLAALLGQELAVPNVAVSFAAPDEAFPPSGVGLPAVSFFLYEVLQSSDLRMVEWQRQQPPGGVATRKRSPIGVDCSYLVTAWPGASAPNPAQDEHHLLGEVMKVLLRHPTIPATYLRGELTSQAAPVPAQVALASRVAGLGEFWLALGRKPRATLHYTVTVSADVFESVVIGPRVTDKVIKISQEVPTR